MCLGRGVQEPGEEEKKNEEESPWVAWLQESKQETEAPVKTKERLNVSKKRTSS
jgi:hypothetical protein